MDEDEVKTKEMLVKTKRVCKYINAGIKIVFIVFCISWIAVLCLMVGSILEPAIKANEASLNWQGPTLFAVSGVVIASIFVVVLKIFSEVSKGSSPFAMAQVKRLQIIALLLLAYAVLDFVTAYNSASLQLQAINSGFISTNDSAILTLNFSPLIASAAVYAFSFVFKYGVLLQEFSDDVI